MKKIKFITSLALILLVFIMNIFNVFSHDKSIPYYIKIGLFFGGEAKSSLLLKSDTTFEAGIFGEDEFIKLFELSKDKILLRKDRFYIDRISNPREHSKMGNIPNHPSDTDVYHVQIGRGFTDYTEACAFLDSIKADNINGYLCYEDGWRVYAGPYSDRFDADEAARDIDIDCGYRTGVIEPSDTRVQVVDEKGNIIFIYDSSDKVYFTGKHDGGKVPPLVNVEGTCYRGGITAKRLSGSDMTIINKLPLEEYLYGVIPKEMPASWPEEALKAQAVAARGFAVTNSNKYKHYDFNLCATTHSQVYRGYSGEHPNTNEAVDKTRGVVMTYNGKLIEPYYHSDSGGCTDDSENVWTNPLPYIRGVKDDFSSDTPYSSWSVTLTKEEIKNRLAGNNISVGDILDIEITSVSDSGRVMSLVIHGTEGRKTLEKESCRLVFGLRSGLFTIDSDNVKGVDNSGDNYMELAVLSGTELKPQPINLKDKYIIDNNGIHEIKNIEKISIYDGKQYKNINTREVSRGTTGRPVPPNKFIFNGKGYGHGLGMSQYGANRMADLGYKYDEILKYYYTGVEVE